MVVMIDEVFYPCMYRVHRPELAQIRWQCGMPHLNHLDFELDICVI
jgi:hypothetical protein